MLKRLLLLFALIPTLVWAQSTTPNIGLQIPATGSNNWYIPLNFDFSSLDLYLSGHKPLPALSITGNLTVGGSITAGSFVGAGGTIFATAVPAQQYSPVYYSTAPQGTAFAGVTPFTGLAWFNANTVPRVGTAADLSNMLLTGAGCGVAGSLYSPSGNQCVVPSGLNPSVGVAGSTQIAKGDGSFLASDATTLINSLMVQEYTNVPRVQMADSLQALHNAANQITSIAILSDSFGVCDQSNCTVGPTNKDNLWTNKLKRQLQALYGYGGTGAIPLVFNIGSGTVNSDYYSVAGTFTVGTQLGPVQGASVPGGSLVHLATGAVLTFTTTDTFDHLNVYCMTAAASGSLAISIDGTAHGTACGTTSGTNTAVKAISTAVALGTHAVTLTSTGDSYVYALEGTAGTTGVRVHNLSVGGATAEFFGDPTGTGITPRTAFYDLIGNIAGNVIMLQTNEPGTGYNVASFTASMTSLLNHVQGSGPLFVSALLAVPPQGSIGTSTLAPYTAAQITLAQTRSNTAFTNIQNRWGTTYNSASGLWDLGPSLPGGHPNDKGSIDEYTQVYAAFNDNVPTNSIPLCNINCTFNGTTTLAGGSNQLPLIVSSTNAAGPVMELSGTAAGVDLWGVQSGVANQFLIGDFTAGVYPFAMAVTGSGVGYWRMPSATCIQWSNDFSVTSGTYDTGMCRDGANTIDFGNGNGGDKSGIVQLAVLHASSSITSPGITISGGGNFISTGSLANAFGAGNRATTWNGNSDAVLQVTGTTGNPAVMVVNRADTTSAFDGFWLTTGTCNTTGPCDPTIQDGYTMMMPSGSTNLTFNTAHLGVFTPYMTVTPAGVVTMANLATTGNFTTSSNIIATAGGPNTPQNLGVSNVQLFTNTTGNQSNTVFNDPSRTANNRIAMLQFTAGILGFGFSNDAWTAGTFGISMTGGQASGITALASNSGTGQFTHTNTAQLNSIFTSSSSTGTAISIRGTASGVADWQLQSMTSGGLNFLANGTSRLFLDSTGMLSPGNGMTIGSPGNLSVVQGNISAPLGEIHGGTLTSNDFFKAYNGLVQILGTPPGATSGGAYSLCLPDGNTIPNCNTNPGGPNFNGMTVDTRLFPQRLELNSEGTFVFFNAAGASLDIDINGNGTFRGGVTATSLAAGAGAITGATLAINSGGASPSAIVATFASSNAAGTGVSFIGPTGGQTWNLISNNTGNLQLADPSAGGASPEFILTPAGAATFFNTVTASGFIAGSSTGVTASGATSCVIKAIVGGIVTNATCT